MNSWWKVEGRWVSSRERPFAMPRGPRCRAPAWSCARQPFELRSGDRNVSLTVAGIVTTGGAEDSQIFTDLDVAQNLAGLSGRVSLVQLSVSGTPSEIEAVTKRLANALPGLDVRPVRQIAAAEGIDSGPNSTADFLDDRADPCALDARSARIDGRAGHGAQPGRRFDEGARRLGSAHHALISSRSRRAGRPGRHDRILHRGRAGAMDRRTRVRCRHFAAPGSFFP